MFQRVFAGMVLTFVGAGAFAGTPATPSPPATRVQPVRDSLHGVEVVDPYRWLEGDAKGGPVTPEVTAWTDAQLAYTRAVLDNLPGRKASRRACAS